uniref:Uncharacterized protein n=1 Tax=Opuntia streptacantha TaxID=393608 RepID=A0A7C9AT85_OPUST
MNSRNGTLLMKSGLWHDNNSSEALGDGQSFNFNICGQPSSCKRPSEYPFMNSPSSMSTSEQSRQSTAFTNLPASFILPSVVSQTSLHMTMGSQLKLDAISQTCLTRTGSPFTQCFLKQSTPSILVSCTDGQYKKLS